MNPDLQKLGEILQDVRPASMRTPGRFTAVEQLNRFLNKLAIPGAMAAIG